MTGDPSEAWSDLCRELGALGTAISGEGFPDTPAEQAAGFRYLAGLVAHAMEWCLDAADLETARFVRSETDFVRWGGPNTDNQYLRARVDPSATYRIEGDVSGVRQLIISTHEGDMAQERGAVFEERNLAQLDIAEDGRVEIVLSPDPRPGNWIALRPDVEHVLVRQYVSDWNEDRVARLHIERIDRVGVPPTAPTPDRIALGLRRAAEWVRDNAIFWNEYAKTLGTFLDANVLSAPQHPPGGARDIAYGGGTYELDSGQVLLIECEVPDATYWSTQLLTLGWMECHDHRRLSSLSGHQTHIDEDGRFRLVVAHDDPGVQNWLDTAGLASGIITYRWVFAQSFPTPTTRVVPLVSLRDHLPESTPRFDADRRRDQLARRERAVARRFQ